MRPPREPPRASAEGPPPSAGSGGAERARDEAPGGEDAEAEAPDPERPHRERCERCAAPLPHEHRHLLELRARELRCACRACAALLDGEDTRAGRLRLVPERLLRLQGLDSGGDERRRLGLPVGAAFVTLRGEERAPVARFPSHAGPTEARLDAAAWRRLAGAHPLLATLAPEVEALLFYRGRDGDARLEERYLAPVDLCLRLDAGLRASWRGRTGGARAWRELEAFFGELRRVALVEPAPP